MRLALNQDDQISWFSAPQIGALSLEAVAAITGVNNDMMTSGCGGFTADQFEVIIIDPFYSWNINCSMAFTAAGLGGWSRDQMGAFSGSPDLFWVWTPTQLQGLAPQAAAGISPEMAKGTPGPLCAGFQAAQIANWGDYPDQHVCEQWSASCLSAIHPEQYAGLAQECMQRLRPDALAILSAEMIGYIAPSTFFELGPKQLAALNPAACTGITAAQMTLLGQCSCAAAFRRQSRGVVLNTQLTCCHASVVLL